MTMKLDRGSLWWAGSLGLLCLGFFLYIWLRPSVLLRIDPPVGARLIYAFRYSTDNTPGQGAKSDAASFLQPFNKAYEGEMLWDVEHKSSDASLVAAQLSYREKASDQRGVGAVHVIPFRFELSKTGRIEAIKIRDQDFDEHSFLVVELLRFYEQDFPAKEQALGQGWDSWERSPPKSVPTHQQLDNADQERVYFTRRYPIPGKLGIEGRIDYELNRTLSSLERLSLEKSRNIEMLGIVSRSRTNLVMERRDSSAPEFHAIEFTARTDDGSWIREDLLQKSQIKRLKRRNMEKTLGDANRETLITAIQNADPSDKRRNMETYLKLKALLVLHPEAATDIGRLMDTFDQEDDRFNMIATALTAAGHATAQEALRAAIQRSEDVKRQIRLIPNLSFTESPDRSTESFLRTIEEEGGAENLQKTAALALGTIAHQLRESEPDRAESIYQERAAKFNQAATDDKRLQELAIIGNIGLPQQIALAESLLDSNNRELRAKAYDSLRHVPSARAEAILVQGLRMEKDGRSKEAASESLTYTHIAPQHVFDIEALLKKEKNIQVLKNLMRALASSIDESEDARRVLTDFAATCAHPDLCGFVDGLIASL